jgi:hypothetical protein
MGEERETAWHASTHRCELICYISTSQKEEKENTELWEPKEFYSERERQFLAHISIDAPLEIVLRGHLWVESSLIRLIEEVLPHPEAIDLARFSFPQKMGLGVALGLVRSEYASAYLKLML